MADTAIPEYRRIRDALRIQLENGDLKPGDRIPTERELCARYGVAHMTVRHAIDGLVRDGLLVRRRGSGTYVVHNRAVSRSINRLQSFTDDVGPSSSGAKVLVQAEVEAPAEVAELLELPEGSRVVELTRLRTVDGEPAAVNQVWVPLRVAPNLVNEDMNDRSLYAYLASIGAGPERAEQRIYAVAADTERARLLGVKPGSPVLVSERVSRDAQNSPVEVAHTWSRPDLAVWVEMRR